MRSLLSDKVKVIANACIKGVNAYNIKRPFEERISMNTKRLQKLLFLCEIEYMKKHNGQPLFEDEFHAWPGGPAIPIIYTEYWLHADCNGMLRGIGEPAKEEQEIVNKVLELTKNLDTVDLANVCCVSDSPWIQVYDEKDEMHRQVITKERIYNFYFNKDLKQDILKIK